MTWQGAFLPEPRVGGSNQPAPDDGLTALTHPPGRLGAAWLHELERAPLEARDRMLRGRNQARRGRLRALEIGPGTASAEVVAETLGHPTLRVRPFQRQEWEVLHAVLRSDLDLLAALMEGDVRDELLQRLQARDVHLVPRHEELSYDCDCGDYVTPCAHVAALMNVITDALDGDPFQLLTLRGRTRDQALAALRETLGDEPVGAMRITPDDEPPPDGDWLRSPTEVPEFSCSLAGHVIPAAGLRALGPIPGAPDLLPALLPLYESGATAAVTILERASTLRPRRSAGDSGPRGAADAAGPRGGGAENPDVAAPASPSPGPNDRAASETPWERERRLRAPAAPPARLLPATDGSGTAGAFGDGAQAPSGAHAPPTPQGGQAPAPGSGRRDPADAATHAAAGPPPDLHLSRGGWRASAAGATNGATAPRGGATPDPAHGSRPITTPDTADRSSLGREIGGPERQHPPAGPPPSSLNATAPGFAGPRPDPGPIASDRHGRPAPTGDARGHIEAPRPEDVDRGPVGSDRHAQQRAADPTPDPIQDPRPAAAGRGPIVSDPGGRPGSASGADSLIGLLVGAGWMTSPQIASASGRRVSEIRRDLAALLRLGAVSREERADGVWWRAADAR